MKGLGFAAGLALLLHGLLFSINGRWLQGRIGPVPREEPVVISLAPIYPPKRQSSVSEKKPVKALPKEKKQVSRIVTPRKSQEKPPEVAKKRAKAKVTKKAPRKEDHLRAKEKIPLPGLPGEVKAPQPQSGGIKEKEKEAQPPSLLSSKAKDILTPEKTIAENKEQAALAPLKLATPRYKVNPPPVYPRLARRRGYEGTVILEVLVNRKGRVEDVRLLKSSGYRILDKSAMDSVKKWLFEPAELGDEKIEAWVRVPIRYQLK